jgi:hypothetical protein
MDYGREHHEALYRPPFSTDGKDWDYSPEPEKEIEREECLILGS